MANITAADIRAVGGFNTVEATDADLAILITMSDAWLTKTLGSTLAVFTALDANNGVLAKAAEMYYAAALFAGRPPKDDISIGPAKTTSKSGADKKTMVDSLQKMAKDLLASAGVTVDQYDWSWSGGDAYHPSGDDDTNIDFKYAQDDLGTTEDSAFNVMGIVND
jgi:hypothetical protein